MKTLTAKDEKELQKLKDKKVKDELPLPSNIKVWGTGLKMYGHNKKKELLWIKQYVK